MDTTSPQGRQRLRQVAKQCVNFGQRVQFSVFECVVDSVQLATLRHRLEAIINPGTDSLRYYFLGDNWKRRVEHVGAKQAFDPEGLLIQ